MQIMNLQEAQLLDMLIELANGDTELVDAAIQESADANGVSQADDVIAYIEEKREQGETAA